MSKVPRLFQLRTSHRRSSPRSRPATCSSLNLMSGERKRAVPRLLHVVEEIFIRESERFRTALRRHRVVLDCPWRALAAPGGATGCHAQAQENIKYAAFDTRPECCLTRYIFCCIGSNLIWSNDSSHFSRIRDYVLHVGRFCAYHWELFSAFMIAARSILAVILLTVSLFSPVSAQSVSPYAQDFLTSTFNLE